MANPSEPQPKSPGPPLWSPFDEYLWYSCDILADVLEGKAAGRPMVATTARLQHGERALAVGPGQRQTWRSIGDGSYTQSGVLAVGSTGFVIGSLVGSAIGNSARRRQAERDAQPRWIVDGTGEVTITSRRLHFAHAADLDLPWNSLNSIELVAADVFQTSFINIRGSHSQMTVRVRTPWASLAFALAAITAFPAHPRLLARGWLPADFEQRCIQAGRPCRPAAHLALRASGT
ncbi:hypothetical protein ABT354_33125 [Streptomyces sp. NPDC000594]|uniref:hypothetical protein n=1 Tax=Streptomyces sp. NPDC000594 TaxID=3154261 RepID=UPI00332E2D6E